jgi:hypothetical protein
VANAPGATSNDLWAEYAKSPDMHSNIPNCSFAGYHCGEAALPEYKVVANVKECGAKGDGQTNDWAAFNAALEKAEKAGGGAVLVPAGTYRIENLIHLKASGVVLRGEGRGKTILDFPKSLTDLQGAYSDHGASCWSWCGGMIWVGPADTFDAAGKLNKLNGAVQGWEYWRPGKRLANVTAAAKIGATKLQVDSAAGLKAGDVVLMTWENPADFSLLKHVVGAPCLAEKYNWSTAKWIVPPAYPQLQWPVEIAAVDGSTVTLKQPLRLDLAPQWKAGFMELGPSVRESGVEKMTLKHHAPMSHKHLTNAGHNSIYVNRALNCWVSDVEIHSTENGVNLAACKNCTVTQVAFTGPEQHHHMTACRVNSHDNLFERIEAAGVSRIKHGLNTEWFSSGNVWHKIKMCKGTFDSHRALSFDSLRTDIDLANDDACNPGGATEAGPYMGKKMVHWNVRIVGTNRGVFVNHPDCLPMGALVGMQGAPRCTELPPAMVPGDKGCLIVDEGKVPNPPDLYEAQLKLRLGK